MRANKWIVVATVATGKPIEHIYCATGHRHETQHGHSVLRNLSGLAPRVERPRLSLPRSACSARSANSRCTALTALSVAAVIQVLPIATAPHWSGPYTRVRPAGASAFPSGCAPQFCNGSICHDDKSLLSGSDVRDISRPQVGDFKCLEDPFIFRHKSGKTEKRLSLFCPLFTSVL